VHRAVELARAGHLRFAARVLERPPLLPITPARLTKLFELHPRRDPSLGSLSLDLSRCITPTVEPVALRHLIRSYHDGKAAGPSNLTTGHLLALASDPDCLLGLVAMVQDVVDGRLGDAARDCITSCVSVPIGKPHSVDGVRPIAVPEVIYKLAGLVVLQSRAHHPRPLPDRAAWVRHSWWCGDRRSSHAAGAGAWWAWHRHLAARLPQRVQRAQATRDRGGARPL
jgi:hypothetical protein